MPITNDTTQFDEDFDIRCKQGLNKLCAHVAEQQGLQPKRISERHFHSVHMHGNSVKIRFTCQWWFLLNHKRTLKHVSYILNCISFCFRRKKSLTWKYIRPVSRGETCSVWAAKRCKNYFCRNLVLVFIMQPSPGGDVPFMAYSHRTWAWTISRLGQNCLA